MGEVEDQLIPASHSSGQEWVEDKDLLETSQQL